MTNDCYSKRTSGPLELIPGQSCLVGIAFQAKNPLGYTGSLTFYTNAGDAKVELVGYLELPNGKTGPFDVHYTPRQKERLKIIKHLHAGLAIITGAAGVIVAPLAIPLGILAAAEGGAAEMYDVMSEDPADMNFRQIAHVRMGAVALVKTSASSYAPVENTLLEDVSKVKALTAVLATSINRAQGAAQSHNQTAEVAQLRAAKTYAVDLASALVSESNAEGALWNEVQKQGQPGSFSASQVSAAAKKAAAKGLPAGEVAALRKAGLTPAAISALARSVATAHGAANLGTAIADSVSANAEGAAVLLSFAAVQP